MATGAFESTGTPMESDWNRIADADLRAMIAAGWTIDMIASALDRPNEAIEARRRELGIDSSPKPKGGLFQFEKRRRRLPWISE